MEKEINIKPQECLVLEDNKSSEVISSLPHDKRGRVMWRSLSISAEELLSLIKKESGSFYKEEGRLTQKVLQKRGCGSLSSIIQRKYPGGFAQLKADIGIHSRRPVGYYTQERVEREVGEFYQTYKSLDQRLMREKGYASLVAAISESYPGKMPGLRIKLGLSIPQKSKGFWTIEQIEAESGKIYKSEARFDSKVLSSLNRSDLASAIKKYYPGGITALRIKLGLNESYHKPKNYWRDLSNIEKEALDFFEREGKLSNTALSKREAHGLCTAINEYYPGRMVGLKKKLGIVDSYKPGGYWNAESAEREVTAFFNQEGRISYPLLRKKGETSLSVAIAKCYPGGMVALRAKLGLKSKFIRGYWTVETIESEALLFYQRYGGFSENMLKTKGNFSLVHAIYGKYPGKMEALKAKLGIDKEFQNINISPQEANEELKKLLEDIKPVS